ncbi:NAD(+) diphosphatase, partial [Roseibium sp.]|uniref:NAD(+) diphosphatase n=1 Tax=Roseibium sp. TaxID=1936156 RepID=UPI003D0E38F1
TTLAGFMEPGETIEQAVRRETLEESGIEVGEVRLISNQPWPFPANLMLGCTGTATSSRIDIEDDELEDCKWCERDEVRQMVAGTHPQGHRIPPSISIAYELITGWLEDKIR